MNPYLILMIASLSTWGVSLIGASTIFFVSELKQEMMSKLFAITSGVMLGVSIFSLLIPAIEVAEALDSTLQKILIVLGIFLGMILIIAIDRYLSRRAHQNKGVIKRSNLIVLAIAAHNLPEALAIGAIFGRYFIEPSPELWSAAILLTLGIVIHNIVEGAAVTFPLYADGYSKQMSFHLGHLSAIVYLPGIFIGYFLVTFIEPMLPLLLAFAVGTMFYVIFDELLPQSYKHLTQKQTSVILMLSFIVISLFELLLG